MRVTWNERARRRHRQQERIGRIRAKLTGAPVGDFSIGVPVITESQLNRLDSLAQRIAALRDELTEQLEALDCGLDCLRGMNHPEGWATVEIVERTKNTVVATVRHHGRSGRKGSRP